ncbi:MAG: prolipoprotein diacylglyceryl transferase, partial [Nonlabens sp.]|nr:prolipoprotein diacylglyceryl transferase [Nonlabens sp.]
MKKWKQDWEIQENWQLIFPALGTIALLICGYMVASRVMPKIFEDILFEYAFIFVVSILMAVLFYYIAIALFRPLREKWNVEQRWEMIAIFLVFAITGSASAKFSGPLMELIGMNAYNTSPWIFWPVRILIIFPIYQVLLVVMGWIFGQFEFFWNFEKKMLSRLGL